MQENKFEEALRFWLASHGMTKEEQDKVCADRRVAFSIKLKDEGGIIQDIRGALYGVGSQAGTAAVTAFNDAGEQFMLMMHLRESKSGKSAAREKREPRQPKPAATPKMRSLSLVLQYADDGAAHWSARASNRTVDLAEDDIRSLAPKVTLHRAIFQMPKAPRFPNVEVGYTVAARDMYGWLEHQFGFRGTSCVVDQVAAAREEGPYTPQMTLETTLPETAYIALLVAKGVIR